MEGLKVIPYLALVIAISGIVIGAGILAVSKFGDTMDKCTNTTSVYNSTLRQCTNASHNMVDGYGNVTQQYQTVLASIDGQGVIGEQLATVGIIGVMVVIISIIAGVFVYFKYFS